jgi:WD40 repeat protein
VEQLRIGIDPVQLGPYRLTARIGQGGMGVVYLGRSAGGYLVAVKVMQAELAANPEYRQRFSREVDAAKRVGGRYTALVLDADPDARAPWMATQYIDGPSLELTVQRHGVLGAAQLRDLGAALAEGLGAIHACGLVHRDLKPANILMAADGPRIIDFGIAQADGVTRVTRAGMTVGTPAYMSPEQLDSGEAGPPSDVFALGGILVYAATGRGPFPAPNVSALNHAILSKSPDLGAIPEPLRGLVAECLDKDPAARPAPKGLLAALGALPGALELPPAPSGGALPTVTPSPGPVLADRSLPVRARRLTRHRPPAPAGPRLQVRPANDSWWVVAVDPAGGWVAAADGDGTIALWDRATGLPTRSWPALARVRALAASRDDWLGGCGEHGDVQVWDVRTGTACASVHLPRDVRVLALDWPGGLLVTAGDDALRVWDVAEPREPVLLKELPCPAEPRALALDDEGTRVAAGCADGQLRVWDLSPAGLREPPFSRPVQSGPVLAVAWDAAGDRWLSLGGDGFGRQRAAAVSAAGHGAAIDDSRGGVQAFPLDEPASKRRMIGASTELAGAAFAGSGLLVTGGSDGALHAWDSAARTLRSVPAPRLRARRAITALAAAPNSARLAACTEYSQLTVFDVADGRLAERWSRACREPVAAAAFSPDGTRLVTAGDAVRVWRMSGEQVSPLPDSAVRSRAVAFDPTGEYLAAAGLDGVVRVWQGSRLRRVLAGHKGGVYAVTFGLDGRLVSAGSDGTIRTWDVGTGEQLGQAVSPGYLVRVLAAHPVDGTFAVGCADGTVRVCAAPGWAGTLLPDGHVHGVASLCFDRAGRYLATAGLDGTARVWDLASRSAELLIAPGAGPDGWSAALALPDGQFRARGPATGLIWQAAGLTRHSLFQLPEGDGDG